MRIISDNDWVFAADPDEMLACLRKQKCKPSARKLRLLAVAACRCLDAFLDERGREALAVAERHADGLATDEELAAIHETALVPNRPRRRGRRSLAERLASSYDDTIISHAWDGIEGATRPGQAIPARVIFAARILELVPPNSPRGVSFDPVTLAAIFRDVFANPFRPVAINPAWHTGNVMALATSIYDERAFDRLPVLADALEDAGCDNGDILNHCREPGEHVRGCWVVDLILGRSDRP
jgi:hypothetical protein